MTDPKVLKLAKILRDMFDMCFHGRAWEDLPEGENERWIEIAEDVITEMKKP